MLFVSFEGSERSAQGALFVCLKNPSHTQSNTDITGLYQASQSDNPGVARLAVRGSNQYRRHQYRSIGGMDMYSNGRTNESIELAGRLDFEQVDKSSAI